MWYVLQVRTGTEEKIQIQCEKQIDDSNIMERCFIPYYEQKRKVRGEWMLQKKILFPGYLFIVTKQLEQLYQSLKSVMGLTKLLGDGEEFIPLKESEIAFLQKFGGEEQVVEISEGVIEGGQTKVVKGPLVGMEGRIKKINRHKKKAWIELEMFGRKQEIEVGLEILVKS